MTWMFPVAHCDKCGLPGNHPDCPHPHGILNFRPALMRGKWYRLRESGEAVYISGNFSRYDNHMAEPTAQAHWYTYYVERADGTCNEVPERTLLPKLERNKKGEFKQVRPSDL